MFRQRDLIKGIFLANFEKFCFAFLSKTKMVNAAPCRPNLIFSESVPEGVERVQKGMKVWLQHRPQTKDGYNDI